MVGDGIIKQTTVFARLGERCVRTSELPLLVRFGVFSFLFASESRAFGVIFFAPFREDSKSL